LETWWDALRSVHAVLVLPLEEILNEKIPANSTEDEEKRLAERQVNVAIALLKLGKADKAWSLLKQSPTPQVRSYFIHWISSLGVDPQMLIGRLDTEPDVSIRRALLLALGEFSAQQLPVQQREPVIRNLLTVYEQEADPGMHGAAEWLLRQWGAAKQLESIDGRLKANEDKLQQNDSVRQWYMTTEGHTMVILNANTFLMGSPELLPSSAQFQHRRKIGRRFAISSKEVTKAQYHVFAKTRSGIKHIEVDLRRSKTDDSPRLSVNYDDAAKYCNWLSGREGIPKEQWCYLPYGSHKMAAATDILTRTGYRLPTEAEWEFACRAGSVTSRYHGQATSLLSEYAWTIGKSGNQTWPVGRLKPNDFGLFDMLGNANEWCYGSMHSNNVVGLSKSVDLNRTKGPAELSGEMADAPKMEVKEWYIVTRGGSFDSQSIDVTSHFRNGNSRDSLRGYVGLRPARTLR